VPNACGGWRRTRQAELVERPAVVFTGEFDTYTREELDLLTNAAASDMEAALYRTAAFTGLRRRSATEHGLPVPPGRPTS
jgi:hypothetical protein